jgi:hypothetical protein
MAYSFSAVGKTAYRLMVEIPDPAPMKLDGLIGRL